MIKFFARWPIFQIVFEICKLQVSKIRVFCLFSKANDLDLEKLQLEIAENLQLKFATWQVANLQLEICKMGFGNKKVWTSVASNISMHPLDAVQRNIHVDSFDGFR